MRCKKLVVWWLVTKQEHPLLTDDDMKIESLIPLVETVLPGVNYFSITGFSQVMKECVIPVLKKRFSGLVSVSADDIAREPEAEVDVEEFFPSDGYEWQDSTDWQEEFQKRLSA